MSMWLELIIQSIALGVALAMDAFSVSMANGLNDPGMKKKKMCVIAGTFAGFQFAMPMIGWFCVTTIKEIFAMFERFIPWIALILLLFIGGKMLLDGIRGGDEDGEHLIAGGQEHRHQCADGHRAAGEQTGRRGGEAALRHHTQQGAQNRVEPPLRAHQRHHFLAGMGLHGLQHQVGQEQERNEDDAVFHSVQQNFYDHKTLLSILYFGHFF